MALGFEKARTSLAATLAGASVALAGCGGGQPGSQREWVPPTEEQAAHCQELYNTARGDAQRGIDDATPGTFAGIGQAIGGNQRRQVPVDTANQTGERRLQECMARATVRNTRDADEAARQQAQAAAASASQPASAPLQTEEAASAATYSASKKWAQEPQGMTPIEKAMCDKLKSQKWSVVPESCRSR